MSAQAVETEILTPMQAIFYPPRNVTEEEQSQSLRSYVAILQGFDGPDLKTAWLTVLGEHDKRAWPLPAQFAVAARAARKARLPAETISQAEKGKASGNQRWVLWTQVSRTELARKAVWHGVSWALKHAILYDGKRPEEVDLRVLVMAKASAERTADAIKNKQPVEWKGRDMRFSEANAEAALRLWDQQLRREAETQDEINYGGREAA